MSPLSSLGTTTAASSQHKSGMSELKQDFQALGQALSSGDLQGAQSAFAKIQQLQQNRAASKNDNNADDANKAKHTNTNTNNFAKAIKQDMDALSKALGSGDLQGAQDAFTKTQQDKQARRAQHLRNSQGSSTTGTTPTATPTVNGTSSSATTSSGSGQADSTTVYA